MDMAPVDNLLKKQLAQIKARALVIAGRASDADVATAATSATPPPGGRSAASNEIIESVVRTGAVTRGRDFPRAAARSSSSRSSASESKRFP
ncbi:MAG TPA: hypothetical protein VFX92_13525, partial [Candidatus Krumholzibacteria bacterium]|nr:hypothetical protein [Candidatus Krumholzibacteria bacterium]